MARNDLVSAGNLWWLLSGKGSKKLSAISQSLDLARADVNRDGSRVLVRQSDGAVALYDAADASVVRTFARPQDASDVKFSDDGRSVVGATVDAVRIWSATDGSLARELKVSGGEPTFVALGGIDERWLAVTGADRAVRIFGAEGNAPAAVLGETFAEPVGVAISADGRRAIVEATESSCRDVQPSLWDLTRNRRIGRLSGAEGCAYDLKFSRDGSEIVGALSEPYRIGVWESEGGAQLTTRGPCLPTDAEMGDGDPAQVMKNGFSDDNAYVYAGTLYGAICVWRNPGAGQALIARARAMIPREFTTAERSEFFLSDGENAPASGLPR